jgi:DNA-binding NarL/FixJ family response regulator
MIRIVIADDHAMVREGLGQVLSSDDQLSVIGRACDGLEAVYMCEMLQPDVVFMDIMMPKMDGLVATRMLRQHNENIRVILLSALGDDAVLHEIIQKDADVILSKQASINEILDTVHKVVRNR